MRAGISRTSRTTPTTATPTRSGVNGNGQVALWEMNGEHILSDCAVGYANGAAAPIDQSWSVLHHPFDLV